MNDVIHLALAGDAEVLDGLAIAAYSALETSSRPVRLWVIEDGIPTRQQAALEAAWRRVPTCAGVIFFSMRALPLSMPSWWARQSWPLTAAARFQLGRLLPPEAERCIYLDTDVTVGTDLAALFDLDLLGHPVAMVPNTGMAEHVRDYLRGMEMDPDRYTNSGVMLIDLAAWRRENAAVGLIEVGRRMPANLWYFDQDMLNRYFKGRCLLLEERWNHRDAAVSPIGRIQHFAGAAKPWQVAPADDIAEGYRAWHRLHARAGFVAAPMPAHARWRKRLAALVAKVQRRLVEATH